MNISTHTCIIFIKTELVLDVEDLLPVVLRSKLRAGHKISYPLQPKKFKLFQAKHESLKTLEQIFDRKAYRINKHEGRSDNDHSTERPVNSISVSQ